MLPRYRCLLKVAVNDGAEPLADFDPYRARAMREPVIARLAAMVGYGKSERLRERPPSRGRKPQSYFRFAHPLPRDLPVSLDSRGDLGRARLHRGRSGLGLGD